MEVLQFLGIIAFSIFIIKRFYLTISCRKYNFELGMIYLAPTRPAPARRVRFAPNFEGLFNISRAFRVIVLVGYCKNP